MVGASSEQGLKLNEGRVTYPLSKTDINNKNKKDEINK